MKKNLFALLILISSINCFATQSEIDSLTNVAKLVKDSISSISSEIYILSDKRNLKLKNPRDFYVQYSPITVNSAGGTGPSVTIINGNKKTIKYISFNTKFYNRVNDPVRDEISRSLVTTWNMQGPIPYLDYTSCGSSGWSSLFYNGWAEYFIITSMTITYMDGTKKSFTSKQIKNSVIDDEKDLWYNPAEKRIEELKNKKRHLEKHLIYVNELISKLKTIKYPIGKPEVSGLDGYTLTYSPKDKSLVEGTVVVRVVVSPTGGVTSASVVGGSVTDETTRTICRGLAQQTTFRVPIGQTFERTGTLTYNIEKESIASVKSGEEDVVFSAATMPSFPGGVGAMMHYINANLRYPQMAQDNNIQGRVVVQFVVEKDGSVGEVKVARSVDKELDAEAIRVCKTFPKFSPGRNAIGEPVRVWYTLPVNFKLQGID